MSSRRGTAVWRGLWIVERFVAVGQGQGGDGSGAMGRFVVVLKVFPHFSNIMGSCGVGDSRGGSG